MVDLSEKIEAEKDNIEKTLKNLEEAMRRKEKSIIELSAIATFLHNIYNGIENILKQILKEENINLPKSATWHKELLELSTENEIISEKLADKLREYLAFRHFFVHGYGFMIRKTSLIPLAKNISCICSEFFSEIEDYIKEPKVD